MLSKHITSVKADSSAKQTYSVLASVMIQEQLLSQGDATKRSVAEIPRPRMAEQASMRRDTIHSYANNSPIFTSNAFEHSPSSPLPTYQPVKHSPRVSNKSGRRTSRLHGSTTDWQRFIPPLGPGKARLSVGNQRAVSTPLQESADTNRPLENVAFGEKQRRDSGMRPQEQVPSPRAVPVEQGWGGERHGRTNGGRKEALTKVNTSGKEGALNKEEAQKKISTPRNMETLNKVNTPGNMVLNKANTPNKVDSSATEDSSSSDKKSSSHHKRAPKYCYACGKQIVGTLVKAMGRKYHVGCFKCYDCGKLCSDKFFAEDVEVGEKGEKGEEKGEVKGEVKGEEKGLEQGLEKRQKNTIQVPLCEYDYFRRINLICYNCNRAIRGSYITAIGQKYHPEHFYCEVCHRVFETEDYYEHGGRIYCHYHYSLLYASHCEACKSAILKQYVEMHRGGSEQQWHPECFMIHKFWGVDVTVDCTGEVQGVAESGKGEKTDTPTPQALLAMEAALEKMTISIWVTLSEFEEACATCISDMLHAATVSNKMQGLVASGRLVLKIECLFKGIDTLNEYARTNGLHIDYKKDRYRRMSALTKEPRSLSSKLMSYLTFLRDSSQRSVSQSKDSRELLSMISMLAHYIKLISRNTLMHSLEYNRLTGTTGATDRYLGAISAHRGCPDDIFAVLHVPYRATGACQACQKSIEARCFRFGGLRWHPACLRCAQCGLQLDAGPGSPLVSEISYDASTRAVLCEDCGSDDPDAHYGFSEVSSYQQLIYLLQIALVRSEHAMAKRGLISRATDGRRLQQDDRYSQQVLDITRMRSLRQNRKVGSAAGELRRSVIVEAPEASTAGTEEGEGLGDEENDKLGDGLGNKVKDKSGDGLKDKLKDDLNENKLLHTSVPSRRSSKFLHKNRSLGRRGSKRLTIEDAPMDSTPSNVNLDATSNLLKNEKGLTLDDIPRIVSSEQAREYRPNAFRFQKRNYETATSTLPVPKPVRKRLSKSLKAASSGAEVAKAPTDNQVNVQSTRHEKSASASDADRRVELEDSVLGTAEKTATAASPDLQAGTPLHQTTKRFSELSPLQHEQLRHVAAFALHILLSDQLTLEDCVSFIDVQRTPSFWEKVFGGNKKSAYSNVHKIFGEPLEAVSAKYGVDSDLGVGPEKLRIPALVDEIINAMRTKDLSAEGVFRLNGNIRRLKKLMGEIDAHPNTVPDLYSENQIQLAALLKKFARGLPDPLLTFKLYDLFILSQKYADEPEKRDRILKLAYAMLPKVHRDLTEVLLAFLNWVATFCHIDEETGSKMDIHNLATVLTPNILYSKPKNTAKMPDSTELIPNGENHFLAIEVVNTMIEKHDDLSIIPPDLLTLYRGAGLADPSKKNKLSTKEIMIMCKQAYENNPELLQRWVE